jgi:hypothetical protein
MPCRHVAAARLSRQTKIFYVTDYYRFRAAFRPLSALAALALKTLVGLRRPDLLKIKILF